MKPTSTQPEIVKKLQHDSDDRARDGSSTGGDLSLVNTLAAIYLGNSSLFTYSDCVKPILSMLCALQESLFNATQDCHDFKHDKDDPARDGVVNEGQYFTRNSSPLIYGDSVTPISLCALQETVNATQGRQDSKHAKDEPARHGVVNGRRPLLSSSGNVLRRCFSSYLWPLGLCNLNLNFEYICYVNAAQDCQHPFKLDKDDPARDGVVNEVRSFPFSFFWHKSSPTSLSQDLVASKKMVTGDVIHGQAHVSLRMWSRTLPNRMSLICLV
ncbi:hypothetical protein EW146_g9202 [Bondarzewia mesenterica]|uniref:Uncharacterized protein n=1 Tax=Bondarzewia mesenterica TaxID=1095465 RepID=A0A4V3XCZ6_9AGAM|nr:hypothetical protein EW146_g9202 [Bondarzewia mesenterica]